MTLDDRLSLGFTNAVGGRDAEFNAWYDAYHLRELVEGVDGFDVGRRYRLVTGPWTNREAGRPSPWQYLALYALLGDDVAGIHRGLAAFRDGGGFTPHGGVLADDHAAWVYAAVGPCVSQPSPKGPTRTGEHLCLELGNPADGRAEDFERWCAIHVEEVVREVPGVVAGRLYAADEEQRRGRPQPRWRALAVYELQADDLEPFDRLATEVRHGGRFTRPEGALADDYGVWLYAPLGERVRKAGDAA